MQGLNWGKGTGAGAETGVMYETHVMGFTPPFSRTTALTIRDKGGFGMTCLVPDEASAVHLVCQVTRPLHVPWEQFVCVLRR